MAVFGLFHMEQALLYQHVFIEIRLLGISTHFGLVNEYIIATPAH